LEIFDGSDFTFKQKSSGGELKDSFDNFFNENIHGQQNWVNFQNDPEKPVGKKSETIKQLGFSEIITKTGFYENM
jgi:hypothetical protein